MSKVAWNKTPIDKKWLEKAYLEEKLSITQIAKDLGASGNVVHNRLKEYRIPRRSISDAKRLFDISKTELEKLYFKKRLSMFQIADYYGCTHGTIVGRFKQFGLKSRGHLGLTQPIIITKTRLKSLYHGSNLSVKQIAKELGRSKGGIERRIRKYGIKTRGNENRKHWKYEKKLFDGSLEDKAYMIGFRLGDLNASKTNQVVVVRGSTSREAQARLFESLFSSYGGVSSSLARRGTIEQYAFLDRSFDFLLPKHDVIETWIVDCSRCFLAFFAGYFDAEGSVTIHRGASSRFGGFEVQSYDRQIILQSWKKLCLLGVECPKPTLARPAGYVNKNGIRSNGDTWRLSIFSKKAVWQLLQWFKHLMKHEDKLRKLKVVEENIMQRNKLGRGRRVIDLSIPELPLHVHSGTHAWS